MQNKSILSDVKGLLKGFYLEKLSEGLNNLEGKIEDIRENVETELKRMRRKQ